MDGSQGSYNSKLSVSPHRHNQGYGLLVGFSVKYVSYASAIYTSVANSIYSCLRVGCNRHGASFKASFVVSPT